MSESRKITKEDLLHIAKLSRLEINPSQEDYFANQLSETAGYIDILNELDTSSVKPTAQVNHKCNVFREDEVRPSFTQEEALSQAPDCYQGYFKTKATIKK